jgi:hypothetical protein
MADHGEVEYATAQGNDLPAHEASYKGFIELAVVGTVHVITILVGLTLGGVLGHWLAAAAVIILGTIVAGASLWTGTRVASYIMLAIALVTLALNAYG